MKLLEFPKAIDIVDQLRTLADSVEAGLYGDVQTVALAIHSDDVWVCAYGRTDAFYVRGLLSTAADAAVMTDDEG